MSDAVEIVPLLKKLRLSGVLETLELRVRQATEDSLAYGEFLLRLLSDEVERREARQLCLRLHRASFEQEKTIGDFRFEFNPVIPTARIIELATCAFVGRLANVCPPGPTGTGKTHTALRNAVHLPEPDARPESAASRRGNDRIPGSAWLGQSANSMGGP